MTRNTLLLTAVLATALALDVRADNALFPLVVGARWEYVSPSGYAATVSMTGTRQVAGANVIVRSITLQSVFGVQDYENYWSCDAEGTIFLHGFTNYTLGEHAVAYVPPIPYLFADAHVGSSWSAPWIDYGNLDGTGDPTSIMTIELRIPLSEFVSVPAGSYEALRLEYRGLDPAFVSRGEMKAFEIDGRYKAPIRVLAGQETLADEWGTYAGHYSSGIGEVRFDPDYELSAYDLPVPTLRASFGQLKARHRN